MKPDPPTAADVVAAANRIRVYLRRTPLEQSVPLSRAAGVPVWLKLENLQRTGSFKARGALNAVLALDAAERARGVVTASAGNHGLGVALAAGLTGVRATVFVPRSAPRVKRGRIAALGAELREVDGDYDAAHQAAARHAEERGARYLHAFSDPDVVAGQGTVALEIADALPEVRTLLVPVGGGGLAGGVGLAARALLPEARVIGVQSQATAAMHASLAAGALHSPPAQATLCDGLAGDVDAASLALARRVVDGVSLVSEDAVRRAIRRLYEEEGITAEGSAATVAAALWEGAVAAPRGPVVAVVSGGNIDVSVLNQILAE